VRTGVLPMRDAVLIIMKIFSNETLTFLFGTITTCDATFSDVYVVLCYVLSQCPFGYRYQGFFGMENINIHFTF
jgi:hypothetical protein